jgi:hypothetical protein
MMAQDGAGSQGATEARAIAYAGGCDESGIGGIDDIQDKLDKFVSLIYSSTEGYASIGSKNDINSGSKGGAATSKEEVLQSEVDKIIQARDDLRGSINSLIGKLLFQ